MADAIGKGSVHVPGRTETNNRRPAHFTEHGILVVARDTISPWAVATPAEIESFVPGDNYPGTDKQRWWNAQFDS